MTVTAKTDTEVLEQGVSYEVLAERTWGYMLRVGKRTMWFARELFYGPKP